MGKRSWHAAGVCVALVGVVAACSTDPSSTALGDLRVTVTLDPVVVNQGEKFEVRVDFVNRGDHLVELTSGATCPYWIEVHGGGSPNRGFPEAAYLCHLTITRYSVDARTTRTFVDSVTANAPPGEYEVRIHFAMEPALTDLTTKLTVR